MPVIKVQDRVAALSPGDLLEVVFTDPGALHDIPAWSRIHGHAVVDVREGEWESCITIRVGES